MFKPISTVRSENRSLVNWFRQVLFFGFFFFLNIGLKFFETDTNQVPLLLRPTTFDSVGSVFLSIMFTPNKKGPFSLRRGLRRKNTQIDIVPKQNLQTLTLPKDMIQISLRLPKVKVQLILPIQILCKNFNLIFLANENLYRSSHLTTPTCKECTREAKAEKDKEDF